MSVIQTQTWLDKFVETCTEQMGENSYDTQCETICEPVIEWFPKISPEELQYELLSHGLFDPAEWMNIGNSVRKMEAHHIWQIADDEYELLRGLWNGPEVSIFIFPMKEMGSAEKEQIPNKNGVAYKGAIFLFLSDGLSIEEMKALLAHEYNHVCRLDYLGLTPDKIALKDSLIIEGLGEYAVKDLYGEKWLAPWTNLYSFEDTARIWTKHFIPSLNMIGLGKHQPFLYGSDKPALPKWIGYYIGFQIIDSFQKMQGPLHDGELYFKSSEELIAGSIFGKIKLSDIETRESQ